MRLAGSYMQNAFFAEAAQTTSRLRMQAFYEFSKTEAALIIDLNFQMTIKFHLIFPIACTSVYSNLDEK